MHQGMLFHGVIPEDPIPTPGSSKQEAEADSDPISTGTDSTDSPGGGVHQGQPTRSKTKERILASRKATDDPHVMWIITEDERSVST